MKTPPRERAQYKLSSRQKAYQRVFLGTGIDGKIVLEDLAQFCRLFSTTFHLNERVHCALTGRHEVILRIQDHLKLNDAELWQLYGNPTLTNITNEGD